MESIDWNDDTSQHWCWPDGDDFAERLQLRNCRILGETQLQLGRLGSTEKRLLRDERAFESTKMYPKMTISFSTRLTMPF